MPPPGSEVVIVDVDGPDLPRLPSGIMRQGRVIANTSWIRDGNGGDRVIDLQRTSAPTVD